MASVTLQQVDVGVDRTVLVRGVDLTVRDGEVMAIIGPSGSGKSTLLRAIAGLARVAAGTIRVGALDVTASHPSERDVAMVFQEPTLLPGRTGRGNVRFPLEIRRETLEAIRNRVDAEARALHIEHLLEKEPQTMSRGEAQLVQIARALVRVPQVLLLDEPFAALDEHRRRSLRAELRMLQQGYGVTTVLATNDPQDALSLADRVVALRTGPPGRPVQVGTVAEVRDEPATLDVAAALGELWQIEVGVERDGDGAWLVGVRDPTFRQRSWSPAVADRRGATLTLGVRSADVVPAVNGTAVATVRRSVPGSDPQLVLDLAGHLVVSSHLADVERGDTIRVDLLRTFVFDADGERIS